MKYLILLIFILPYAPTFEDTTDSSQKDNSEVCESFLKPIIYGDWICSGEEVPKGYVVSSWRIDINCPGFDALNKNSKYIQKPGNYCWVCSGSPVPEGYIVSSRRIDINCPGFDALNNNSKFIKKL